LRQMVSIVFCAEFFSFAIFCSFFICVGGGKSLLIYTPHVSNGL
jgi:hypothetical protein